MDTNQSAARDARRFLADRVRNDWTFPSIADVHANAAGSGPDATYYDSSVAGGSEDELRGVTQFRERYYGSTDDDNDDDDDDDDHDDESDGNNDEPQAEQASTTAAQAGAAATGDNENEAGGGSSKREYKFDSPEHVGRSLEERAQRRKRRRRAKLEEEMAWNEGVRCFVRRRDAWTGAASVRKYARRRSRASAEMDAEEVEAQRAVDRVLVETASVVEEVVEEKKEGEDGAAPAGKERQTEKRINVDIPASEEPLVPLAPPLLPHNAIRQSITPKAYPDIYGKIVVAGQTPKVPINLAHMTRALVQGWKDDGEWPPRPGPADPLMGRKKVALAGGRVGTLAAVLGGGDGSVGKSAASNSGHHGEFLAHHPHLQKGVESVKKVFRLSGGHHGHSNPSGGIVHDGQPPAS